MRDGDLDEVQRALETLLRLHASRTVHAKVLEAAGASVSQPGYALLRCLDETGPQPLGDVARTTHMDPAVASRQIRQLQAEGLVVRGSDEQDGRVTLVEVTPRGSEVRRRIATVLGRHMSDVLESWSEDDRRRLGELLARLVDDLRATRYRAPERALATHDPAG